VYFGHVLTGLCMRRLARRFEVLQSAGLLALSESAERRASLEGLVTGTVPEAMQQFNHKAALFESYVEGLASSTESEGGTSMLREMMALTPAVLAAARRHTNAVFGHGLREEIFKPLTRASKAVAQLGTAASNTEVCIGFLLEAARCGELRMLSLGPTEKERLLWDGVLFGALLRDAEDLFDTPA